MGVTCAPSERVVKHGDCVRLETRVGAGPTGSILIFGIGTEEPPSPWRAVLLGKPLGSIVILSGIEEEKEGTIVLIEED